MTETIELSLRGLPEWLIREYLGELGAASEGEADTPAMTADGWSVIWTHQRVQILGSAGLGLTQFDMTFTGEPDAVRSAHDDFMKKAQRGGG